MVRIDIYDERGSPLEQGTEERDKVHREGTWHRNVYVVPITPSREILMFLRDKRKASYGGFLAVIGEHPYAGEHDFVNVALRGVQEDTGIILPRDKIVDLGLELQVRLADTDALKDCEFQHYFAVPWDIPDSQIQLGRENTEVKPFKPWEIGNPPCVVPMSPGYLTMVMHALVKKRLLRKQDIRKPGKGFFNGLLGNS